jgi:hypothetical protein
MSGHDLAKLKKCMLMLSSRHDGEVVAAARQINRLLASASVDWHWLANRVDGGAVWSTADMQRAADEAYRAGRQDAAPAWRDVDAIDHRAAADWLLSKAGGRLRPKDIEFLQTMTNWRGRPTERQGAWLADLVRKHGYKQS